MKQLTSLAFLPQWCECSNTLKHPVSGRWVPHSVGFPIDVRLGTSDFIFNSVEYSENINACH